MALTSKDSMDRTIFGLPLKFIGNSDPQGRVYAKTFLRDLPLVTFLPGEPTPFFEENGSSKEDREAFIEEYKKGDDYEGMFNLMKKNAFNEKDMRYYTFNANYGDYFKYLNKMASQVYAKMGGDGFLNLNKYLEFMKDDVGNTGIPFFADKSSSITESPSNEWGESKLQSMANKATDAMREGRMLLGMNFDEGDMQNDSEEARDEVASAFSVEGIIDRVTSIPGLNKNTIDTVVAGANLMFPEVWKDSTYESDISLSFKFRSPYGDMRSIFKFVYMPFLSLLALTLPKQNNSMMGYVNPFLVRVESLGWFSIDMGAVTSMSFKRGGEDNLWTDNGWPMAIDITVNLKEMYPTMRMSKDFSYFHSNQGLSSFLDNLAGLGISELRVQENIKTFLQNKAQWITGTSAPVEDMGTLTELEITNTINNIANDLFQ